MKRCLFCGQPLKKPPPKKKRPPRFYSRVCAYCEQPFTTRYPFAKFCSASCYYHNWRENRRLVGDPFEFKAVPKSGIVGIRWYRVYRCWRVIYRERYVGLAQSIEEAKRLLNTYREKLEQCA